MNNEGSSGVITIGSSYTYSKFRLADLFFDYSEKKNWCKFRCCNGAKS
ncbi:MULTISPECIES: hypothetical protein [Terrisporobacter]|nr:MULTISPECIES: hypothetical protein [Terrisporobacter]MCC3670961.1 hypothetical protein [Terrisporobacter mayombei]